MRASAPAVGTSLLVISILFATSSSLAQNNQYENNNYNQQENNSGKNSKKTKSSGNQQENEDNYNQDNQQANQELKQNYNINQNYNANETTLDEEDESETDSTPHPFRANAWSTKELIMSSDIPKREDLVNCRNEIRAVGEKAINDNSMVAAVEIIIEAVRSSPKLYHWCFYYAVMLLDMELESRDLTRSYEKMSHTFTNEMKAYWILARSLDKAFDSKKYFGYLRKRYIQISQDHFGKHLQIISAPLGDENRRLPHLNPKAVTPAFSNY